MVELPLSEVITLSHHLQAGAIRSLLNRSAQRFEMVVELVQNGVTRTAGVRGQDIYAVTAPIVIEAALRLMATSYRQSGALALAEAVDPVELLCALHGRALDVFGDALPG